MGVKKYKTLAHRSIKYYYLCTAYARNTYHARWHIFVMRINKTLFIALVAVMSLMTALPVQAQKFTKKAEARREARAKNYFYGHTFTVQAGLVHSWLTRYSFTPSTTYGATSRYQNTRQSFDLGFTWDYACTRYWGLQLGTFYSQQGGQLTQRFKNTSLSVDYGTQLLNEKTENVHINDLELEAMVRGFLPLTAHSRLSLGVGPYVGRIIAGPDASGHWTMGLQANMAYEWEHVYVGVTYQPGLYESLIDDCNTALNALWFNVGFRFWK